MDLKIEYTGSTNRESAFNTIKEKLNSKFLSDLKINCEIEHDPENFIIIGKGRGFSLKLFFTETACEISLELSFLLTPAKNKILDIIVNKTKGFI